MGRITYEQTGAALANAVCKLSCELVWSMSESGRSIKMNKQSKKKLLARIISVIGLILVFLSIARQNHFWPF